VTSNLPAARKITGAEAGGLTNLTGQASGETRPILATAPVIAILFADDQSVIGREK
jgi:hypothetical protein